MKGILFNYFLLSTITGFLFPLAFTDMFDKVPYLIFAIIICGLLYSIVPIVLVALFIYYWIIEGDGFKETYNLFTKP